MPQLYKKGTDLHPDDRKCVLASYVHRYTMKMAPQWAQSNPEFYKPQFKDDIDWLENSKFHVTKDGRLDQRFKYCESTPTWPMGKWGAKE